MALVSGYVVSETPLQSGHDHPRRASSPNQLSICWIGLDTTSGMVTSEAHTPLACTPGPGSAAPITGSVAPCETTLDYVLEVERVDAHA